MRVPQLFFRKQTGSWCVPVRGRQYPLGTDREDAWIEYHRPIAGEKELTPSTPAAIVIDNYLDSVSVNQADTSYEFYKRYLAGFAKFIGGRLRVCDLKPYHVIRWVDRDYGKRSDTTKFAAYRSAQRAFNWAKKAGVISASPIETVDKPTPGRREVYLTPEQYGEIVKAVESRKDNKPMAKGNRGRRESEGFIVPLAPADKAGRGKGPCFGRAGVRR
jgi:hypothetical protein